jgi:cellulose synthase/poly-beta-1,6-N-acetylglucosamine synthase-like glycosyltransferase
MAVVFFWAAGLFLLHTYFLYPLVLVALDGASQLAGNFKKMTSGSSSGTRDPESWPTVTLVVAAYNEASCIGEKVANTLSLDYPPEKFQMIVGSDGSNDGTDDIVRQTRDPRVTLSRADRAGKTTVLNRCIPMAGGDIIVLTDANTVIDPAAVKKLVRHFSDPEVGVVVGKLRLYNRNRKDYEESVYWSYESLIKLYEGRRGAVLGANGGLYAIRRRLYTELPASTIVDDFVIPMRILDKGYKVLYEPDAIAYEETTEDYGKEFGRRARIAAGNFQSLALLPGLLSPTAGFAAFAFWSHKVFRWCAPALMAVALVANLFLLEARLYQATLVLQLGFYALALAGRQHVFGKGALERAASVAYYFVTMNAALAVGFWRFARNAQRAAWDRTARA